jgi:hypothetical protein
MRVEFKGLTVVVTKSSNFLNIGQANRETSTSLDYYSILNMEATCFSESSVNILRTTPRYIFRVMKRCVP